MMLAGAFDVFVAGAVGGVLAELVRWYQLRESPNLPAYASSLFYWVVTGLMVAAGGALAVLYGTTAVNALLAVNVGASAPLIIKALAQNTPPPPPPPAGQSGGGAAATAVAEGNLLVEFLAGR